MNICAMLTRLCKLFCNGLVTGGVFVLLYFLFTRATLSAPSQMLSTVHHYEISDKKQEHLHTQAKEVSIFRHEGTAPGQ